MNNLAVLHKDQNRFREAKALYEQALAIYRKAYNDEHPDVAAAYNNLAALYYAQVRRFTLTKAESHNPINIYFRLTFFLYFPSPMAIIPGLYQSIGCQVRTICD